MQKLNDNISLLNSNDEKDRTNALVNLSKQFFDFGSSLASKLPPIVSDIIGFQFKVGSKLINDGTKIINKHIDQIKSVEKEIDEIINGKTSDFDFEQLDSVRNGLSVSDQIENCQRLWQHIRK